MDDQKMIAALRSAVAVLSLAIFFVCMGWYLSSHKPSAEMESVRATSHNGVSQKYYFCIWHTTFKYFFDKKPTKHRNEVIMYQTERDVSLPYYVVAQDLDNDGYYERISIQTVPNSETELGKRDSAYATISKDGKVEFFTTFQEGFVKEDKNPIVTADVVREIEKRIQQGITNLYNEEHCERDEMIMLHDFTD